MWIFRGNSRRCASSSRRLLNLHPHQNLFSDVKKKHRAEINIRNAFKNAEMHYNVDYDFLQPSRGCCLWAGGSPSLGLNATRRPKGEIKGNNAKRGGFVADEMPLNSRIFRQNKLRRDSLAASRAESCRRKSPRTRRFEIKKKRRIEILISKPRQDGGC